MKNTRASRGGSGAYHDESYKTNQKPIKIYQNLYNYNKDNKKPKNYKAFYIALITPVPQEQKHAVIFLNSALCCGLPEAVGCLALEWRSSLSQNQVAEARAEVGAVVEARTTTPKIRGGGGGIRDLGGGLLASFS